MRRLSSASGFTLIELLVVVLIIGILIAVAAPSFLGQSNKAQDSVAKQYLALTYREAKAAAASNEDANGVYPFDVAAPDSEKAITIAAEIQASEPHLHITYGDYRQAIGQDPTFIVVDLYGDPGFVAYNQSKSGQFFCADAPEVGQWGVKNFTTGTCPLGLASGGSATGTGTDTGPTVNTDNFTLTVHLGGSTQGSVTSDVNGLSGNPINCLASCADSFNAGTTVTLTAHPASGQDFTGWAGTVPAACTAATTSCAVTVNTVKGVTALFSAQGDPPCADFVGCGGDPFGEVSVSLDGTGAGTVVTSSIAPTDAGDPLTCLSDCDQFYNSGAAITLSAMAATGSHFAGWSTGSGDLTACSGTGDCSFTVSADTASQVTAVFTASGGCDPSNTDYVLPGVCPTNPPVTPTTAQCNDGIDNDSDGLTDFPNDPGCSSATDNSETNAAVTECNDGIDNDSNSLVDFPADPGCSSAADNTEASAGPVGNHFNPSPFTVAGGPIAFGADQADSVAHPNTCNCVSVSENDVISLFTVAPPAATLGPIWETPVGAGTYPYQQDQRFSAPVWNFQHTKIAVFKYDTEEVSPGTGTDVNDLWVMNADGSGQTELTAEDLSFGGVPLWSPDGTKILITASDPATCCTSNLYVVNALAGNHTSGNFTELTDYVNDGVNPESGVGLKEFSSYAWDGSGNVIANLSDGSVVRMDASGGSRQTIIPSSWGEDIHTLALSYDGQTLAYDCVNSHKICTFPYGAGNAPSTYEQVVHTDSGFITTVAWAPNGAKLAYSASQFGNTSSYRVYTMPAAGGSATNLSGANCQMAYGVSWSADGSALAFRCSQDDIFTHDKVVTIATATPSGGSFTTWTTTTGRYRLADWGNWGPFALGIEGTPYFGM
jgi:prepilin-type N-terminal cleavage/methylation domain-containing protein